MKKGIYFVLLSSFLISGFQQRTSHPAIDFLSSLQEKQQEKIILPINDQSKEKWHYFPSTMFSREGLALFELNKDQKDKFFTFLRASLSESGYSKTLKIIELEAVLAELGGSSYTRDPEKYFVAFYGDPRKDELWQWSFEGHHVSLNFSFLDGKMEIAPRFMGANPATILSGKRKGEQTLAVEQNLALKLINDLSAEQRKVAIFRERAFYDIVTGNSSEVDPLKPVGIELRDLNQAQQEMLVGLINEYLSTMPETLALKRMAKLKQEEFDVIRFGWAGETQAGRPHYYRIQGKTFLVEFDNTQNGANHIHSVWRDFDGDFGRDLIREHYQSSDHHH